MNVLNNVPSIALADIDLDDTTFLISYGFDLELLKASIRSVGLINPPVLRQGADGRYQVVCGHKRIRALRALGFASVPGKLVSREANDASCLLVSLYDNVTHRELNPIEKSLGLNRLLAYFSEERIVRDFLPLLKLQPHISQLRLYQPLCLMDKPVRDAVIDGIIDVHSAQRLSRLDAEGRECLSSLLIHLRLSVSKQAEVITAVTEICLRDGVAIKEVTGDPNILSILTNDKLNRPQKGDAVLRYLREKRYPRLSAKEKQVKEILGRIPLPPGASITPPPFFEDNRYCLSVYFTSWQELMEKLDKLDAAITRDLAELD